MIEIGGFSTTSIVILVVCIAAIVWDVWLWVSGKATISQVIRIHAFNNPVYAFVAGFLCGHWFF